MAEEFTTGAILIKEGMFLPEDLQLKSEPYLKISVYSTVLHLAEWDQARLAAA
jgi:hypothetical protein